MDGITFQAIFLRATTTVDGGWNVTFSVSQDEAEKIMQVSQMRDSVLQLACVPVEYSSPEPYTENAEDFI